MTIYVLAVALVLAVLCSALLVFFYPGVQVLLTLLAVYFSVILLMIVFLLLQ